ncbi:MAG: double-strand break repair protein AddB [Henriciella sp.]|jgi:ATP-dependent helicase/nuclease subunit B
MSGIFAPDAPRVYSIPPGANFLGELAETLARETGLDNNPEALADALVYVPNRRSERALAFALHKVSGRNACLLPDIRALGDLETEDPPPSAEAALANLPPVISPAARIGGLTRLVMAYYAANDATIPAVSALSAARELASLLDQAALSGDVDWAKLESVVTEKDLARHWDQSVQFLKIITDQWPAQLEEATQMDPYARRYAAAEAMAQHWLENPPQTPVIIAGSTGATPASRLLMQAVTQLPQGLVILPGLDREVPENMWDSVSETPSHPQFTLVRSLKALDLSPSQVANWPATFTAPQQSARRRLVHEALAPARNTADWTERLAELAPGGDSRAFVTEALNGLTLIETPDDADEAMSAALLMRETLETPDQTAALITPDAGLARHVSALLKQWDVDVPASSGIPLSQTQAGSLVLMAADWLTDTTHPVKLLAVMKSPMTRFTPDQVQALDKALRGPRTWTDWDSLELHLANHPAALEIVRKIQKTLINTDAPNTLPDLIIGEDWLRIISAVATEIAAAPTPWSGEAGASLSTLIRELTELTGPLGPQPQHVFNELLFAEARNASVRDGEPHPRLAIWGPLEARLQTADRVILAGLTEGIWPAQPPADAFLPRTFRQEIGLSDPDERIGLSAHDFAQFAAAPNVTLLSSQRRDDKPVVASRWIWRLRTLARGALGDAAEEILKPAIESNPLAWIESLGKPPPLPKEFTAEPRPSPALDARPKGLSVTRIEQLVRDPYAIYAQYVLGLYKLDPLNLPADVRIRGTAIHRALELFEDPAQDKSANALLHLLETELAAGGEPEADLIALRDKRLEVAEDYIQWRSETAHEIEGKAILERKGSIQLDIAGNPFTLSGTADRMEKRIGGGLAILDFKSGKPPSEKQVRSGLSPQMPLQGLIATRGGYDGIPEGTKVDALTYLQFGTKFEVREIGEANSRAKLEAIEMADLISETERGLIKLLTQFANPDHPYLSAPRPERIAYESDYTRLARRDEWTGEDTYD